MLVRILETASMSVSLWVATGDSSGQTGTGDVADARAVLEGAADGAAAMLAERDELGRTPFWWACRNGHEKLARYLAESAGDASFVHEQDESGKSPLFTACNRGHLDIAKWLVLDRGADTLSGAANSPLKIAWLCGHTVIVNWLTEYNKDPASARAAHEEVRWPSQGAAGGEPSAEATAGGAGGGAVSETDAQAALRSATGGFAPLGSYDAGDGAVETAAAAIASGADPAWLDHHKASPVHHACRNGHLELARFLVADGAQARAATVEQLDAEDVHDRSPLALACAAGHLEVVKWLVLEHAVWATRPDVDKKQPLDHAKESGQAEVAAWLEAFLDDRRGVRAAEEAAAEAAADAAR